MGYSAEIYREAEKEIEKRRKQDEDELDERRRFLFEKRPEAEKKEQEIARISVAAGRAVLRGADIREELEALRDRSLALQAELRTIMIQEGLPENWLDEWHQCEKCRDRGYIDGRMCDCLKKLARQTAYDRLNRISPLSLSGFDSFSLRYYSDEVPPQGGKSIAERMGRVLEFCKRYARDFSPESHSLLFQGCSGLGKTHLSLAIAQSVINSGYDVVYVTTPDILYQLETERFSARGEEKGATRQLIAEADLLILDDLGTELSTKFSVSEIYNIINTRILSSHPTIISTNLSLEEMQNLYGVRMVSRIIGQLDRVEFVGTDIRQLKRKERKTK